MNRRFLIQGSFLSSSEDNSSFRFNHIAPVEKRNLDASSWNGHDSIHIARLSEGFMTNKWDANQFLKSWKHTAIPRAGQGSVYIKISTKKSNQFNNKLNFFSRLGLHILIFCSF